MSLSKSRENSTGTKRASQWEDLMRKFSEEHKTECKTVSMDIPRVQRSVKQFPTGSQYEGTWDLFGMSGYGVYKFPNGVTYEGEFDDGMFHGLGDLIYPSGEVLRGTWKKGKLLDKKLVFADGLEYDEVDWKYCRRPDRRFTIEQQRGLQPAGESFLTADQPTRVIPPGYYDTGDGFYDPKTRVVYKFDDLSAIVRSPSVLEQKWIMENCRTCPDAPLGPRPDLYEEWLDPQISLPTPPTPATTSRAADSPTQAQPPFEQDREIDCKLLPIVCQVQGPYHHSSSSTIDDGSFIHWTNWRKSSAMNQRAFIKFDDASNADV